MPSHPLISPPSRHANPFATCWTRPGAIPFRFSAGQSAEQLVAKLATQGWRGAIVGPHGSGKSTLLAALEPALISAGRTIQATALRDGQRKLPKNIVQAWEGEAPAEPSPTGGSVGASPSPSGNVLIVIDGYEQLACWERFRLWRRCHRSGAGLLVTSHTQVRMPTLIQLSPDRRLVEQLVAELCARVSSDITPELVAASHACYGSNVREILFDLYDRHEQLRRSSNSLQAAS